MALRLETFGGLTLFGAALPASAHQRRRLALLALLAAAGARGVSRDRIIALFWPERSAESGRHSLEQLLYSLRRSLGARSFVGVDPVVLDPLVVPSDVAEFRAALAAGKLADAVAVHRGPFLDGFYLSGAPELERWVETEREQLAALNAHALERLAIGAATAGDAAGSVRWWRRLAAVDPLSGRAALGLMRALVAAGDRAAALQFARNYERMVREELESPPDHGVSEYLAQLRTDPTLGHSLSAIVSPVPDSPGTSDDRPEPTHIAAAPSTPPHGTLQQPRPRAPRHPGRQRWSFALIASLTLAGALGGEWRLARLRALSVDAPLDTGVVAVLPWRSLTDEAALRPVVERAAELARLLLPGDGGVRVVRVCPERRTRRTDSPTIEDALIAGRAAGAGQILLGDVAPTRDGVSLNASLLSVADRQTLAVLTVAGPVDSLSALVDHLMAAMLAARAHVADGVAPSALTRSSRAMHAYVAGLAAHRRGEDVTAVADFDRALEADSGFVLAAFERATAPGWLVRYWSLDRDAWRTSPLSFGTWTLANQGDAERWLAATDIAWHGRSQLSDRQRAVLEALRGAGFPRPVSARVALVDWEHAVERASDVAEAQRNLGLLLLHQGLALGLPDSRVRAAAAFRAALALDADDLAALAGLVEVAALDGDTAALPDLAARYIARDSAGARADYVRWRVGVLTHNDTLLHPLEAHLESLRTETLDRTAWASQVSGVALDDADRASAEILRRTAGTAQRRIALFHATALALNRGRPEQALRLQDELRQLVRTDEPDVFWERRIENALFADGDTAAAVEAVREATHASDSEPSDASTSTFERERLAHRAFVLATWRLANGDTGGVTTAIASLRRASSTGAVRDEAAILDAQLAVATHRADALKALGALDSLVLLGCCQPKWLGIVAARLHERLGDAVGALRVLRAGAWAYAPHFWPEYLREERWLAMRIHDHAGAARADRLFLALRSAPEPTRRAEVEWVRAELARLERGRSAVPRGR